jgi:RHS repeat-associated protein
MSTEEQYVYNAGGLLTQVKKKGHNTNFITEDNVYDSFGNITKKIISGNNFSPRETNYQYDSSGRFLTKSIDVEGLATTYSYNTANGLLNSQTNPYGLTTSYLYDSWFKKTKTTDYLGKSSTHSYTPNTEKTKITTSGDDGSFTEELYDDLGRKITISKKDLNGNISSVSYLYDIYDRNYKISEPYSGTRATQWNQTKYDVYGRPTQNISFTGKNTNISYSGLVTTISESSKTKSVTKNALGNTISMTDTPGGTITYTYFANGNLKSSNYDGITTTIEQDGWGRKTKLIDPSAGTYTYSYNDIGENLTETTPNGTTTYTLSAIGKLTQKTIVGTNTNTTTTYVYDTASKLLKSSTFVDALENNATTTTVYSYDSNKRWTSSVETTPYATFTKQLTYDAFGRVNTEASIAAAAGKSSAKTVQHTYKNGQPWQIIDTFNSQVLWQTNTINARGQLTGATMANGNISITNTYDSYGFISQTKQDRMLVSPGNIMTLTTVFDPLKGNLTSRTNNLFSWNESFTYDALDRLTSFKNTAGSTETQSYDDRGRITQNAVGTYNYTNTSKAYQNTSITLTTAALPHYQTNTEQNISYNTFKSPYQIEELGKDKISFTYNDNNSRSTMFYGGLQVDKLLRSKRKYYSADGSMEIKHNIQTGAVEFVTYIGGDGYNAPVVLKSDGTSQNYLYLQRDYQGSIVAISDATGQVLEKRLFDAWGNVLVKDGAGNTLNGLILLDRGYTGHEHLLTVGLIHMNGRLYDAKLHRFLQPDNYVQDPGNTQNYNRYGYVLNNPLKYIDPSGEYGESGGGFNNDVGNNGAFQQTWNDPEFQRWLGRNFSARNIDKAGTAVGKAARDAFDFVAGNVHSFFKGIFGGKKSSGPPPNMGTNANMNPYTFGGSYSFSSNIIKSTKTATYYSDGSAFFNNEVEGYRYMVNKSNMGQKNAIENYGYITRGGVAVLPNSGLDMWGNKFKNTSTRAENNVKGYMWMGYGKKFTINFHGQTLHPIAWIHTHPDFFGGYGQSSGDTSVTATYGIPSVVIGRYSIWYQTVNDAQKDITGGEVMSLNELLSGEIPLIYNLLRLSQ